VLANRTAEDFILAQIYVDNNLYADAIALLLPLSATPGGRRNTLATSPITQLVLGKIYQDIGARSAARTAFELARDLAETGGDLESKAIALENLAQVAATDGEHAAFLDKAGEAWANLGVEFPRETGSG
jgi:hypothetical protein